MTATLLLVIAIVALLLAGFAAIGARSLREFSSHELEEYSEHRSLERFEEVLDRHDDAALAAEALQSVATALLLLAGTGWLLWTQPTAELTPAPVLGAFVVAALVLLLVTLWIPSTIAKIWSVPLLFHSWPVWQTIQFGMWPLTAGVRIVEALIRRIANRPHEIEDEEEAFEDEIRTMVTTGHREGLLEEEAREMIEGVIELGDTDVSDIMTPMSAVDALDICSNWQNALEQVVKMRRTRIPVYEDTLDNIIGVLFVKDLLVELSQPTDDDQRSLRQFLREPWFVPKTKPVDDLLQEFLNTRSHLAIVKDEYDSVAGVVTIEDVLEEIVGEIIDESDQEAEQEITRLNGTTAEVLGRTHLDELNDQLGCELPESDDFDTVAGLILVRLGHIPQVGESIEEGNVRIAVLERSRRSIERVRVEMLKKANGRSY